MLPCDSAGSSQSTISTTSCYTISHVSTVERPLRHVAYHFPRTASRLGDLLLEISAGTGRNRAMGWRGSLTESTAGVGSKCSRPTEGSTQALPTPESSCCCNNCLSVGTVAQQHNSTRSKIAKASALYGPNARRHACGAICGALSRSGPAHQERGSTGTQRERI